jgi:predicted MFS family arabinose efflux permease
LTGVGLGNLLGTWLSGQSARFFPKRYGLSFIYAARALVFIGFLFLPITPVTVIVLSVILGLLWLSTIPLTSGLVGTFFGAQWMTMLYGIVFLSHQAGSFLGAWSAGLVFDATKSYDVMWWVSVALGLFAALVHLPIREEAVLRPVPQAAE